MQKVKAVWVENKSIKMKKNNLIFGILTFVALIAIISSCKNDSTPALTAEQKVESALNAFVANLVLNPPTTADISDRVKNYMQTNSTTFYGSTVTLLDSVRLATTSPYWYRSGDSLLATDLAADTAYHINSQLWLRQPIDGGVGIWTDPYFDAGGGNIWMKTRSVPVIVNGEIIAVATTDLPTP